MRSVCFNNYIRLCRGYLFKADMCKRVKQWKWTCQFARCFILQTCSCERNPLSWLSLSVTGCCVCPPSNYAVPASVVGVFLQTLRYLLLCNSWHAIQGTSIAYVSCSSHTALWTEVIAFATPHVGRREAPGAQDAFRKWSVSIWDRRDHWAKHLLDLPDSCCQGPSQEIGPPHVVHKEEGGHVLSTIRSLCH